MSALSHALVTTTASSDLGAMQLTGQWAGISREHEKAAQDAIAAIDADLIFHVLRMTRDHNKEESDYLGNQGAIVLANTAGLDTKALADTQSFIQLQKTLTAHSWIKSVTLKDDPFLNCLPLIDPEQRRLHDQKVIDRTTRIQNKVIIIHFDMAEVDRIRKYGDGPRPSSPKERAFNIISGLAARFSSRRQPLALSAPASQLQETIAEFRTSVAEIDAQACAIKNLVVDTQRMENAITRISSYYRDNDPRKDRVNLQVIGTGLKTLSECFAKSANLAATHPEAVDVAELETAFEAVADRLDAACRKVTDNITDDISSTLSALGTHMRLHDMRPRTAETALILR